MWHIYIYTYIDIYIHICREQEAHDLFKRIVLWEIADCATLPRPTAIRDTQTLDPLSPAREMRTAKTGRICSAMGFYSAQDNPAQTDQPTAKTHKMNNNIIQPNNKTNIGFPVDTPTVRNRCLTPNLQPNLFYKNQFNCVLPEKVLV